MKKLFAILSVVFLAVTIIDGHAKSYYSTAGNGFGALFPNPAVRMQGRYRAIEGDRLVDENATMATALGLDTTGIRTTAYRYQLRLANTNNKQGKSRTIKDPMTGGKTTLTSTEWGLVFNRDGDGNYCAVVLSCENSAPLDDITDRRTMRVRLIRNQSGQVTELASQRIAHGVSLEDGDNTLCVDVDERGASVSIGKSELVKVIECNLERPIGDVRVGYLVGPGACVSIERAVLTIDDAQRVAATATTWSLEALDERFSQSTDPVEGYWRYLDRDLQDEWLRLGGRYTLALVGNGDGGYDIVYVGGARVMRSQWEPGMVKGHLRPTIFAGNYDLEWIDATLQPLGDEDAYATLEGGGAILTLNYPLYKSQVRYARVLDDADLRP